MMQDVQAGSRQRESEVVICARLGKKARRLETGKAIIATGQCCCLERNGVEQHLESKSQHSEVNACAPHGKEADDKRRSSGNQHGGNRQADERERWGQSRLFGDEPWRVAAN